MSKVEKVVTGLLLVLVANITLAADPLQQLVERAQRELTRTAVLEQQRLLSFQQNVEQQEARLDQLQQAFEQAQIDNKKLNGQLLKQQPLDQQLERQLQQESTELKMMLNTAQVLAKKVSKALEEAGADSEFYRQLQSLEFAQSDVLPSLHNLQQLWITLLQGISTDAQIRRFAVDVIGHDGVLVRQSVIKVGAFATLDAQGNYLFYNLARKKLQVIAGLDELRGPAELFVEGQAQNLLVDPSGGMLFRQHAQRPNLIQRMQQGGIVGYIIIAIGGLGLILALWRILYIQFLHWRIARELKSGALSAKNPLGRLLRGLARGKTAEQLELMADEQILRELPTLERCQSVIKLFAAVAPLLGLLGTVTGMIATFQSITLLGVSDPKLMAAGISQALITTVLGLCVAIPLLFAHSYLSGSVRRIVQLLQHSGLAYQCEFLDAQYPVESQQPNSVGQHALSVDQRLMPSEVGHAALV